MVTTFHGRATKEVVEELIRENPEWLYLLYEVREKVKKGFFPEDVVDALGQYFYSPEIEEYHSFAQLWQHLWEGDLIATRVRVGKGPLKDKFVADNADALAGVTWVYWEVEVRNGTGDDDGFINLKSPLVFVDFLTPQNQYVHEVDIVSFPLEIGYQTWSKTLINLRMLGRLARWPYGSEHVWLFKIRKEARQAMQDRFMERLGIRRSVEGEL